MAYEIFDTIKAPHIILKACRGAVVIRSNIGSSIRLKGDDYTVDPQDDQFTITSNGALKLYIPEASTVTAADIEGQLVIKNISGPIQLDEVAGEAILKGVGNVQATAVHGNLIIKNCDGPMSIADVHGDAYLRNVGEVNLAHIYGDLSGRNINGNINIETAQGDVGLRTVNGYVAINTCYRDVNLRNIGGQLTIAHVHGDVRLYGGLANGDHTVVAQGDIVLRWPTDADLNLTVHADEITNDLPLENLMQKEGMLTGHLGDSGKTNLALTSRRAILRSKRTTQSQWGMDDDFDFNFDFNLDLEKLGEQISAQVTEQVSKVATNLEEKFGGDFAHKIAQKVEQAAARAEKAAEKARRRVEQQMSPEYMDRRRRSGMAPTAPPSKAKEVNPEEQLKILKMVEKGLISSDEATMLLDALEE